MDDIAGEWNEVQLSMPTTISSSSDWDSNNSKMVLHEMALVPCP